MESYTCINTDFKQKAGRTNRLNINDTATIIWIVPEGTQAEQWFNKATKNINKSNITIYNSINELLNKL